ncbi:hypothetical protein M3Y98_00113600 [Aphelenchoides besseyi]|nr:hypothetical protein M3Y98_00113600 [Aphelenchoides besseyi]KAI6199435.1 hypothetical protein M3Y96_00626800 [Aphelenchoides besseyi]
MSLGKSPMDGDDNLNAERENTRPDSANQKQSDDDKRKPFIKPEQISALAKNVNPTMVLDSDVEHVLSLYTFNLVETMVKGTTKMTNLRNSKTIDLKDYEAYVKRKHWS